MNDASLVNSRRDHVGPPAEKRDQGIEDAIVQLRMIMRGAEAMGKQNLAEYGARSEV